MPEPMEVNGDSWQTSVMDSELPVLVDFWAEVVRALQDDRAGGARSGPGIRREAQRGQAGRRQRSRHRGALRHPQHSGADFLQEWAAGRPDHRGAAEAGAEAQDRRRSGELKSPSTGVDGARWPLRTSNPLCLVTSGVGGFDSLALPPIGAETVYQRRPVFRNRLRSTSESVVFVSCRLRLRLVVPRILGWVFPVRLVVVRIVVFRMILGRCG